jgi:hypothetical protein
MAALDSRSCEPALNHPNQNSRPWHPGKRSAETGTAVSSSIEDRTLCVVVYAAYQRPGWGYTSTATGAVISRS